LLGLGVIRALAGALSAAARKAEGLVAVNRTKVLEAAQKFLSKGQYDKAIAEYQKLVTEDPRDVRTLLKIGDLHTRRNKPKDAIDVYQKVAELYAKQGFFLKAVAVYKQILKLDPTHIDSSQKLAKMYEELALTSDALSTYEQVADAYLAQNQVPKALETMQRMVDLDPQNIAVRIKYAEALSKADKAREAAKAFADGAHLLKEQGRMDDYIRVVERQLYHDADNLDIARELSSLYLERSDPKRALAKLQLCFKADPRDIQTLEMLAEAFRQLGQIPKTISVLKEISRLQAEVGAQEPRRRTLKRILDLDPNDAEARQGMGSATAAAPAAPQQAQRSAANAPAPSQPQPSAAASSPRASQGTGKTAVPRPAQKPVSDFPPVPDPDDIELEIEASNSDPDDVLIVSEPPPPMQPPQRAPVPAPATRAASNAGSAPMRSEPTGGRMQLPEPSSPRPANQRAARETMSDNAMGRRGEAPEGSKSENRTARIAKMLDEADKQEGAGRYDAAEALLKQVLAIDAEHLPSHERLKDLYLATDRRVDAVRELLWLSDEWNDKNRERAAQYAKAAFDLAPNAGATRNRLRALGIDPDDKQEEVMFVDDSRATALERDDTGEASLDAIIPRMGDSGAKFKPPSSVELLTRNTLDRPAQEDPLDVPLSPDDFDAEPPRPVPGTLTPSLVARLLDQPISPDEFELEPDTRSPAVRAAEDGGEAEPEFDNILDAPISPDEFDAPPPRRDPERRRDVGALLDRNEPDDFGLSDERFDRSGLIDVEEPGSKQSVAPQAVSTVPPGRLARAQLIPEGDEPSIEFAEINTGELDVDGHGDGDEDDGIDQALQVFATDPPQKGMPFPELGTDELLSIPPTVPPKAEPPRAPLPAPIPAPQARVDAPKRALPPAPMYARKDEADFSDLDFDAVPDPTVRGEPIPELVRQSIRNSEDAATPAAIPSLSDDLLMPSFAAPPEPQPRDEDTEQVIFHVASEPPPAMSLPAPAMSLPAPAMSLPAPAVTTPPAPVAADAEVLPPELEEALDEADFFSSQGMHDEALEVVQEAILIYPKFRVLKQKLAEYEAKADAQEAQEEAKADVIEDDSFDIAQQLATELAEAPAGESSGHEEMVDVESVFAQFKKGVAQQISVDDSDTHFDLGIAYKEMGLIEDAIQEFETAALGDKRACTAWTMIGMCSLERGDVPGAIAHFERALSSKVKSPAEELALNYELGNAHELVGQVDRAVSAFEKVAARDRTFRGVTTRLDQLKKRGNKSAGALG
jgi:tetratricopeptide (TPR) repeat protein